tara:strand:+ start:476 stop:646 length:171 start_codon:yes stop_codon:yes gene_type:complete
VLVDVCLLESAVGERLCGAVVAQQRGAASRRSSKEEQVELAADGPARHASTTAVPR